MDQVSPLLPYRLSICGIDELPERAADDVSHVVSILDPDFPEPLVLGAFPVGGRVLYRFDDVIRVRADAQAPSRDDVERLLDLGARLRDQPVAHLLVHCHAGVSRSTAAAAILMAHDNPGREREAFAVVERLRPRSWPNSLMVRLGDEALGRDGALVAAMQAHHASVARSFPDFAEVLRGGSRAHEVPDILSL